MAGFSSDEKDTPASTPPVVVEPANQAPTITLEGSVSADEKSELTIAASAADSDGSIATYTWASSSGQTVELSNADTNTMALTLPEVMANEDIGLTLTVTDGDGASSDC